MEFVSGALFGVPSENYAECATLVSSCVVVEHHYPSHCIRPLSQVLSLLTVLPLLMGRIGDFIFLGNDALKGADGYQVFFAG